MERLRLFPAIRVCARYLLARFASATIGRGAGGPHTIFALRLMSFPLCEATLASRTPSLKALFCRDRIDASLPRGLALREVRSLEKRVFVGP